MEDIVEELRQINHELARLNETMAELLEHIRRLGTQSLGRQMTLCMVPRLRKMGCHGRSILVLSVDSNPRLALRHRDALSC